MRRISTMLAMVLVVALAACSNLSFEDGQATFDVNLDEDAINSVIGTVDERTQAPLLDDVTSIDFIEPDVVRATGTKDGQPGSYDMTFTAADNSIRVEVTAVDIEGMELTSDAVTDLNEELTSSFEESADPEGDSGVSEVRVEDDQLVITVTAALDGS
ncbi:MAG TPA: hypothetical protein VHM94_02785 [Acidimicrobiia bacterium]|nr:hypothetical protein [Acidimicrobiia bacterium]